MQTLISTSKEVVRFSKKIPPPALDPLCTTHTSTLWERILVNSNLAQIISRFTTINRYVYPCKELYVRVEPIPEGYRICKVYIALKSKLLTCPKTCSSGYTSTTNGKDNDNYQDVIIGYKKIMEIIEEIIEPLYIILLKVEIPKKIKNTHTHTQ